MTWSDTAPTESGKFLVRDRVNYEEFVFTVNRDGDVDWGTNRQWSMASTLACVQFGPRIPPADELAELTQLAEVGRKALESWGMTLEQWQAAQTSQAQSQT